MGRLDELVRFREYLHLDRKRTGEGLTPQEHERLRVLGDALARRHAGGAPPAAARQRESLRVPTRMKVVFPSEAGLCQALMTNLSRGGLFVNTLFPLAPGARLELRLRIEETGEELIVPVCVASNHVGPALSTASSGMGCRFLDPGPDVRKRLEDLYEKAGERADAETKRLQREIRLGARPTEEGS